MSGRAQGRGHRRGAVGAAVDPFNDRFPDDTATFDDLADVFLGAQAEPQAGLKVEDTHAIVTPPGRELRPDTRGFDSLALRPGETRSTKSNLGGGGGGGGGSGGSDQRTATRAVELLVLGHLPALASVWGSQYLRDLARTEAMPIASLRLQAGFASVEVFEFGPGTGLTNAMPVDRIRTFDEALMLAAEHAAHWVLRVDGADELEFIDGNMVTRVTLATGADEAATISAYRTIKRMATRIESLSPVTPPTLHVVVMGTNPEQNQRTGEKLASTAKACLGREVGFHTSAARIGAVRPAVLLFNGKADVRPRNVLATLETAIRATEARGPQAASDHQANAAPTARPGDATRSAAYGATVPATDRPLQAATGHADESDLFETDLLNDEQLLAEVAASLAARVPASTTDGSRPRATERAHATRTPIDSIPAPAVSVTRSISADGSRPMEVHAPPRAAAKAAPAASPVASPAVSHAPSPVMAITRAAPLASYVESLTALGLTCPYAPSVEIACDQDGRVHVLTRFDDGTDETAMGQLMVAAEWASAHGALLRAAAPHLARALDGECSNGSTNGSAAPAINPGLAPARHVFTNEPRRIRRLLETDVRVHLLSRVCTGAEQKWFSVPLN